MSQHISVKVPRGGNTPIEFEGVRLGSVLTVTMEWTGEKTAVDGVGFMLNAARMVRSDDDIVFYNQRQTPDTALEHVDAAGVARQVFRINLAHVPYQIERLAFALALSGGDGSIGQISPLKIKVFSGEGVELCHSEFDLSGSSDTSYVLGELFRLDRDWKFKSVGQGYAAGLRALAKTFGVVIAEASQASGGAFAPGHSAPATADSHDAVFERPTNGYGELQVNLSWASPTQAKAEEPVKKGFLGGLLKSAPRHKTFDIDLCCLFELADGYRGSVQALGGNFGAFHSAPYVELMGDERGDAGAQGELLRVNGTRWHELRRVLVYAMIFDGVPNWTGASARASIKVPDNLPLTVRLDGVGIDKRVCTIAMLENVEGKLAVRKLVETYKNPRALDEAFSWGLRWTTGFKD